MECYQNHIDQISFLIQISQALVSGKKKYTQICIYNIQVYFILPETSACDRYLGFTISSSGKFNQCKLDLYKKSMIEGIL